MADKSIKMAKNVAGKYYVDTTCVGCGQCVDIAGDYFAEENGEMYVKAQPTTDEGKALCEQALSSCPVESIGNDGE